MIVMATTKLWLSQPRSSGRHNSYKLQTIQLHLFIPYDRDIKKVLVHQFTRRPLDWNKKSSCGTCMYIQLAGLHHSKLSSRGEGQAEGNEHHFPKISRQSAFWSISCRHLPQMFHIPQYTSFSNTTKPKRPGRQSVETRSPLPYCRTGMIHVQGFKDLLVRALNAIEGFRMLGVSIDV